MSISFQRVPGQRINSPLTLRARYSSYVITKSPPNTEETEPRSTESTAFKIGPLAPSPTNLLFFFVSTLLLSFVFLAPSTSSFSGQQQLLLVAICDALQAVLLRVVGSWTSDVDDQALFRYRPIFLTRLLRPHAVLHQTYKRHLSWGHRPAGGLALSCLSYTAVPLERHPDGVRSRHFRALEGP